MSKKEQKKKKQTPATASELCDHHWQDYGTLKYGDNPTLQIEACTRCGVQRRKPDSASTGNVKEARIRIVNFISNRLTKPIARYEEDEIERIIENFAATPSGGSEKVGSALDMLCQAEDCTELATGFCVKHTPHDDTKRMDWLSNNLSHLMMVNPKTSDMYSLPNNGNGWKDGELRKAVDAAMRKEV